MKFKMRAALTICLLLGALVFITGCTPDANPYKGYDEDHYSVSVRFDAGDGTFTDNVSVVTDTFNIEEMKTNADGQVEIPLISPTDEARGERNFYTNLGKEGCFLVGWYTQRTQNPDGEGYTYSGLWSFETDRLKLDSKGDYSSSEPVLTLYAAWAPKLSVEFVNLDTGSSEIVSYDPNVVSIEMPSWDIEEGTLEMGRIPSYKDHTFEAAYYDEACTMPIDTDVLQHTAEVDYSNGTVKNPSMKVYVDWKEGNWYRIYTAEQFRELASPSGNYEIMADLDFTGKWPTVFMHGNFSGTIIGNGHTFSNIYAEQTNKDKLFSGLFGNIKNTAVITDLNLDNVTFLVKGGASKQGATFGLFAGQISEGAVLTNVSITNSVLQISSSISYNEYSSYIIGRVCGIGYDASVLNASGITVEAVNEEPSAGAATSKVVLIEEVDENLLEISVVAQPVEQPPEIPSEP